MTFNEIGFCIGIAYRSKYPSATFLKIPREREDWPDISL